jgi:TRAP-type C4-dicarboxylate transport system permease small subunit
MEEPRNEPEAGAGVPASLARAAESESAHVGELEQLEQLQRQLPIPRGGWHRFAAAYATVLSWLLVLTIAVLVVPVTLQIFARYTTLIPTYIWTEELARFMFVWSIMLGAMIGVRESSHFVVDVWPLLPVRATAALDLVGRVATLVFACVFVWYGIEFTRFAWGRISELAELPLWLIHVAWPVAGVTWIVFGGEHALRDLRLMVRGRA